MACGGTSGSVQKHLTALSSTQVIEWFTGWISCTGLDDIMPALVVRAATSNNFEAQVVIQVAKVHTDSPESPSLKGTAQTPTGGKVDYNPGSINISSDTSGAMFIRFGVAYRFTDGQAQCAADVLLEVAYTRCGELAGSGSWSLDTAVTTDQYQVLTGWLPSLLVQKVKLAVVCTSLTGNLQWRLAFRTATTLKTSPSNWNYVTDNSAPYASGEVNTSDLPITLGSNLWVQFAVAYKLSSAGSGQASLTAALGVRRSPPE